MSPPSPRICLFCWTEDHRATPAVRWISGDDYCEMHVKLKDFKMTDGVAITMTGGGPEQQNGADRRGPISRMERLVNAHIPPETKLVSVAIHADKPAEFLQHGGKELIAAAVKTLKTERRTMPNLNAKPERETCSVEGCETQLKSNNKSGRCTKHQYIPKGTGATGARKPKKQRKTAKPAAADNSNGQEKIVGTAATLIVTEQQIDHMFTSWPLEDKVLCIQAFLDRGH